LFAVGIYFALRHSITFEYWTITSPETLRAITAILFAALFIILSFYVRRGKTIAQILAAVSMVIGPILFQVLIIITLNAPVTFEGWSWAAPGFSILETLKSLENLRYMNVYYFFSLFVMPALQILLPLSLVASIFISAPKDSAHQHVEGPSPFTGQNGFVGSQTNEAKWIIGLPGYSETAIGFFELRKFVADGLIKADSPVKDVSSGQMLQAKMVSGLFSKRDYITALLLSVFLGGIGVDRFYLGQTGLGIVKLLTAGGCGVWSLIDIILIAMRKVTDNEGLPLG
jgi:TM2 domain-containing membrane protein YozV